MRKLWGKRRGKRKLCGNYAIVSKAKKTLEKEKMDPKKRKTQKYEGVDFDVDRILAGPRVDLLGGVGYITNNILYYSFFLLLY